MPEASKDGHHNEGATLRPDKSAVHNHQTNLHGGQQYAEQRKRDEADDTIAVHAPPLLQLDERTCTARHQGQVRKKQATAAKSDYA